jgi:D-galactose 1-dehydrogenase
MKPLKLGLVGLGKIAVDQHIPAIRQNPKLELVAGCAPSSRPEGLVAYASFEEMLSGHPDIEAVAICTPPQVRHTIAKIAIEAGKHVFLEKPPAATLGEAEAMFAMAKDKGVSLLASWHSRFSPAVEPARDWMSKRAIKSIRIDWKEDVRVWHPGQAWLFEAGGMGIFDPGINALSILTRLLAEPIIVKRAELYVPVNYQAPIQVELDMFTPSQVTIQAEFDFLQTGPQIWSIYVESVGGETLALHHGGAELEVNGKTILKATEAEYSGLYSHFETLVRSGQSDADFSPLRIVADALLLGRRHKTEEYLA